MEDESWSITALRHVRASWNLLRRQSQNMQSVVVGLPVLLPLMPLLVLASLLSALFANLHEPGFHFQVGERLHVDRSNNPRLVANRKARLTKCALTHASIPTTEGGTALKVSASASRLILRRKAILL